MAKLQVRNEINAKFSSVSPVKKSKLKLNIATKVD